MAQLFTIATRDETPVAPHTVICSVSLHRSSSELGLVVFNWRGRVYVSDFSMEPQIVNH